MKNENLLTVKGKFVPMHAMNAHGGAEVQLYLFLFTALDRGALLPKMNSPVPKKRKDCVLPAASMDIFEMTKISCP